MGTEEKRKSPDVPVWVDWMYPVLVFDTDTNAP
jgi:hypothetical protein